MPIRCLDAQLTTRFKIRMNFMSFPHPRPSDKDDEETDVPIPPRVQEPEPDVPDPDNENFDVPNVIRTVAGVSAWV